MLMAVDVLVPDGTDDEHDAFFEAVGSGLLSDLNRLLGGDVDSMAPPGDKAIHLWFKVRNDLTARGLLEARQRR
jgi:hypothetical protein